MNIAVKIVISIGMLLGAAFYIKIYSKILVANIDYQLYLAYKEALAALAKEVQA